MKNLSSLLFISCLLTISSSKIYAQNVSPNDSINYINKVATVCGKVAQVSVVDNSTFINIDKPHPYQNFYFYYPKPNYDAKKYINYNVCATGIVKRHNGKLQIKLKNISDLSRN